MSSRASNVPWPRACGDVKRADILALWHAGRAVLDEAGRDEHHEQHIRTAKCVKVRSYIHVHVKARSKHGSAKSTPIILQAIAKRDEVHSKMTTRGRHHLLPCNSESSARGSPLRRCSPSQFCETTWHTTPAATRAAMHMWAAVGWQLARSTLGMATAAFLEAFSSCVQMPCGPR